MEIDEWQRSLVRAGIPSSDRRMLKVRPLVYVAYADGEMARIRRERRHTFAGRGYDLSAAGAARLRSWLDHAPTHEHITEGSR